MPKNIAVDLNILKRYARYWTEKARTQKNNEVMLAWSLVENAITQGISETELKEIEAWEKHVAELEEAAKNGEFIISFWRFSENANEQQ